MYIEKINGPEDVKKIDVSELPKLAEEMRHALLIRASKHGGHFGPNFGMWRQQSRFIMCLIHRKIKLYLMCHTRAIHIRC